MIIIRHIHRLMTPEEAVRVAAEMNATEDDGWAYEASHAPNGKGLSCVVIYDEDGLEVGKL